MCPNLLQQRLYTTRSSSPITETFSGFQRFFTDGSKCETSTSYAVVGPTNQLSSRLEKSFSVYSAELLAIDKAIHFATQQNAEKALVLSDSQSSLQATLHVELPADKRAE